MFSEEQLKELNMAAENLLLEMEKKEGLGRSLSAVVEQIIEENESAADAIF